MAINVAVPKAAMHENRNFACREQYIWRAGKPPHVLSKSIAACEQGLTYRALNRGFFAARAPIVIAQRNVKQTRATFEASVSDSILKAINQYWDVVQARESLKVTQ